MSRKKQFLTLVIIGCCSLYLSLNAFAATKDGESNVLKCGKIPNSSLWNCSLVQIICGFKCSYVCYEEHPESQVPVRVEYPCKSGWYGLETPVCTPARGRPGCDEPMMPRAYCLNLLDQLINIFCDCKPPDPASCELDFKLWGFHTLPIGN